MGETATFCWLRFKRHEWQRTGGFRFGPGAFNRGVILRCRRCGHRTTTTNPERLGRLPDAS